MVGFLTIAGLLVLTGAAFLAVLAFGMYGEGAMRSADQSFAAAGTAVVWGLALLAYAAILEALGRIRAALDHLTDETAAQLNRLHRAIVGTDEDGGRTDASAPDKEPAPATPTASLRAASARIEDNAAARESAFGNLVGRPPAGPAAGRPPRNR